MNRWTTVGEAAAYEKGYIEGIADASQRQWIPVTKGLPTENNSYLVWMPFTPEGHHITVAEWRDSYWNIKTPVAAWMLLPTPYREGGRDNG